MNELKTAPELKSGSNLEKVFASGEFAITAELGPPKSADVDVVQLLAESGQVALG